MTFKIYTKTGDSGQTSLVTGQRVSKADLRIEAYGNLDELNAVIGLLICELNQEHAPDFTSEVDSLMRVQKELFSCGSELSCAEGKVPKSLQGVLVETADITRLEQEIDRAYAPLPKLANFVLPGGNQGNALAHLARTICRRAERVCVRLSSEEIVRAEVIKYVNRLSDWFFALSRSISFKLKTEEVLWIPRKE